MAESKEQIRLDGSYGAGISSHITLITADAISGTKDTTYEFPLMLVNLDVLKNLMNSNLILGYRVEKILPVDHKPLVISLNSGNERGE